MRTQVVTPNTLTKIKLKWGDPLEDPIEMAEKLGKRVGMVSAKETVNKIIKELEDDETYDITFESEWDYWTDVRKWLLC